MWTVHKNYNEDPPSNVPQNFSAACPINNLSTYRDRSFQLHLYLEETFTDGTIHL